MKSHQIADAIGVLSALADKHWTPDVGAEGQSDKWTALRTSVYHLKDELEEMAKKEAQE